MRVRDFQVTDVFAGGGGLSRGMMNAGFGVRAAFDNWRPAIAFYKSNFKHEIIDCDLNDDKGAARKIQDFNPQIIVGGPPCQDFSSAGKRDENGSRANLTISYAKIVASLQPRFFIMENVDRAVKSRSFYSAITLFKKAGYGLTTRILDASFCGAPQIRKRVFVIGELEGTDDFLSSLITEALASKRMTVRDYLGDAIDVDYYYRHPRSYMRRGIFSVDEPSPTIRGINRPVPAGYTGHPGDPVKISKQIRPLSTMERALIQTFPTSVQLEGTKTDVDQIIGNAVPIKLAEFVANALAKHIRTLKA